MTVDFILDITCLWSYIAWMQLRKALNECDIKPEISPFFISSETFFIGFDIAPAEKARMLEERARPVLGKNNIEVDFDKLPELSGDVSLPCRLIRQAFLEKKHNVLDEVFAAFFSDGQDITVSSVLLDIAKHNGIKKIGHEQHAFTSPPLNMPEGLRTVPCLIFDKRTVLFGVQSVPCLKNMLFLTELIKKENLF